MSRADVICDRSKEKLTRTPEDLLTMTNLKMLFLEGNLLSCLTEDFFWRLPNLMWLDLRNNFLEEIPKSIAFHENLENLLLTNNNLKKLPNELGLVSKLKTLQVSENPLVYPLRKIIVEGTKAIKIYLKNQYEKLNPPPSVSESDTFLKSEDDIALSEDDFKLENERLVSVIEDSSSGNELNQINSISSKISKKSSKPRSCKPPISEKVREKLSDPHLLKPTLNVKPLENDNISKKKSYQAPVKIVHKISKTGSRISLKSYLNRLGVRTPQTKNEDENLRIGWLNQLRVLLNDQEKILQQERNLRAMSDWRWKQSNSTPKVFKDRSKISTTEPPFAVYPEYSKIPSREELAEQISNFLNDKGITFSKKSQDNGLNIDKLLNDLMQQLKEMEEVYGSTTETRSPRSEINHAGKQIKTIMDIQKKLLQLKAGNCG